MIFHHDVFHHRRRRRRGRGRRCGGLSGEEQWGSYRKQQKETLEQDGHNEGEVFTRKQVPEGLKQEQRQINAGRVG